jgi:hypothetical protein
LCGVGIVFFGIAMLRFWELRHADFPSDKLMLMNNSCLKSAYRQTVYLGLVFCWLFAVLR